MTRSTGASTDSFCAVHAGQINSFERFEATISDPTEFVELISARDGVNDGAISKMVAGAVGGVVVAGPLAVVMAPALGGFVGSMVG